MCPVIQGLLLGLVFAFSPVALHAGNALSEIASLARAGAPQLALQRLDAVQPAFDRDRPGWMVFERERIYLLRSQGDIAGVDERLAALPDEVSDDFRAWANTQRAESLLEGRHASRARGVLRSLLWSGVAVTELETRAYWRRMVIESYLQQERLDDARTAMVRYQQDFGDAGADWKLLRAQVLLRTERYGEVLAVLDGEKSARGMLLALTAQLRSGQQPPEQVFQSARALAEQAESTAADKGLAWMLAVEASRASEPPVYIGALEKALSWVDERLLAEGLFTLNADMLWDAYLDYGQAIGNREQRLLGQDEDWYFPATEAIETDPARARVLFAVLGQFGSTPHRRELAHEYLVSLFESLARGDTLLRRLYLGSSRYADTTHLPAVIRYRLIDESLETGNLDLASRLMQGLDTAPRGTDAVEWALRRARVAIHTARPEEGAEVLKTLMADGANLTPVQLDRWVQVVFDLQTVKAHRLALGLFDVLMQRELEPQRRRELLFWQADSWRALGDSAEAARLYLQSAILLDPAAMDPWAQTARFHAAQSLADAGLLADARRIYQTLLNSTRETGRRAVLRNEIQRLQLRASAKETPL